MSPERLHWTGALSALAAIAAFGATAQWPGVTKVLMGLGVLGVFLRGVFCVPRSVLYVVALVLTILLGTRIPANPPGSFIGAPSYIIGLILAPLLLIFLFRKNSRSESLFALWLASMLAMDAGMTIHSFPYAYYLLAHFAFFVLYLRAESSRPGLGGSAYALAALVVTVLLAGALAHFLGWTETKLNLLIGLTEAPLSGSTVFADRTRLTSIEHLRGRGQVVLRVTSPAPPTHLTGRCYIKYENGTWESSYLRSLVNPAPSGAGTGIFPPEAGGNIFLSTYLKLPIDAPMKGGVVDRVNLVSPIAGSLPVPREAVLVAAQLPSLSADPCGIFFYARSARFNGEYFVARKISFLPREPQESVTRYLQLPAGLSPSIKDIARKAAESCTTAEQKADALRSFLHGNFTYGRGYAFPSDRDPLEEFLLKRPPAHCEFFASAMALMARSLRIPARYVTGFLVKNYNRPGGYYMVKEEDAHAWVELYFPRRGWVTYDPTPANAFASSDDSWTRKMNEWLDLAAYRWQRLYESLAGKKPKEILVMALAKIQGIGEWLLQNPLRLLILLALAVPSLIRSNLLRRLRRRRQARVEDHEQVLRVRELLARLEAALASSGLKRSDSLTLAEWALDLEEKLSEGPARTEAIKFLDHYIRARYGKPCPEVCDVKILAETLARAESHLRPHRGRKSR